MSFEKVTPERPLLRVNLGQFADLVQAHHNTVGNWVKAGMPADRKGNTASIDLWKAIPWVRAHDRKALDDAKASADPDGARAQKLAAEAALKELDLAERRGQLVKAADVATTWSQMMVAIRESVIGAAAVAVQDGIIEPAQEAALEQIIIDALAAAKLETEDEEPAPEAEPEIEQ